jgi:glycine/D-amino acid oxidase-like deaminating enzyme
MAETVRYTGDPPRTAELVIIGGGIVGAATAFHASRAGLRPVLLERRGAVHADYSGLHWGVPATVRQPRGARPRAPVGEPILQLLRNNGTRTV